MKKKKKIGTQRNERASPHFLSIRNTTRRDETRQKTKEFPKRRWLFSCKCHHNYLLVPENAFTHVESRASVCGLCARNRMERVSLTDINLPLIKYGNWYRNLLFASTRAREREPGSCEHTNRRMHCVNWFICDMLYDLPANRRSGFSDRFFFLFWFNSLPSSRAIQFSMSYEPRRHTFNF